MKIDNIEYSQIIVFELKTKTCKYLKSIEDFENIKGICLAKNISTIINPFTNEIYCQELCTVYGDLKQKETARKLILDFIKLNDKVYLEDNLKTVNETTLME